MTVTNQHLVKCLDCHESFQHQHVAMPAESSLSCAADIHPRPVASGDCAGLTGAGQGQEQFSSQQASESGAATVR